MKNEKKNLKDQLTKKTGEIEEDEKQIRKLEEKTREISNNMMELETTHSHLTKKLMMSVEREIMKNTTK